MLYLFCIAYIDWRKERERQKKFEADLEKSRLDQQEENLVKIRNMTDDKSVKSNIDSKLREISRKRKSGSSGGGTLNGKTVDVVYKYKDLDGNYYIEATADTKPESIERVKQDIIKKDQARQLKNYIKNRPIVFTDKPKQETSNKSPLTVTFGIMPLSKISSKNAKEQIALKTALPILSAKSNLANSEITVTGKRQPTNAELKLNKDIREDFIRSNPGVLVANPKPNTSKNSFFGLFDEPSLAATREFEYMLEKKASIEDTKQLRKAIASGGRESSLSLTGAFYHGAAAPYKILNRPLTTVAIVGGALLTRGALGSGGLLTSGQVSGALASGSVAVSSGIERSQGGSGSRTLGETGFYITAAAVLYGGTKALNKFTDKTSIKYSVTGKDIEGKDFIGTTKKGSTLRNKPYKEVFYTKGDKTFRTIEYQGKTLKIVETNNQQAISIFSSKGKLIGSDWRYIDPTQSIRGSILPQLDSRSVTYFNPSEAGKTAVTKLQLQELRSGQFQGSTVSGNYRRSLNFQVGETFKREFAITDQVTITRSSTLRAYSTQQPDINFGAKTTYPKDQVIIQEVGFGKNAQLQRIDIAAPRVLEKTRFARAVVGTIEISKDPISLSLGKKGSAALLSSVTTSGKPEVTLGGSFGASGLLNFQLASPEVSVGSATSSFITPIFTNFLKSGQTQSQSTKLDPAQFTTTRQKIKTSQRPAVDLGNARVTLIDLKNRVDLGQTTDITVIQKKEVGLKQGQSQTQTQIPRTLTQQIKPGNFGTGFKTNINPPDIDIGITPPPTPFSFNFDLGSTKSTGRTKTRISGKTRYSEDLESALFGISGSMPKFLTPFTRRPIAKRKKKRGKR